MISATQIRKALKLFVFDPKEKGTEWHIQARDMSAVAHIRRSHQLLSYYLEGVHGELILLTAGWHLACGVAKLGVDIAAASKAPDAL